MNGDGRGYGVSNNFLHEVADEINSILAAKRVEEITVYFISVCAGVCHAMAWHTTILLL